MNSLTSKKNTLIIIVAFSYIYFLPFKVFAQKKDLENHQLDIRDVVKLILKKDTSTKKNDKQIEWSFLPIAGYTANNGFVASLALNINFRNNNSEHLANQKISSILTNINYTSSQQTIIPLQMNIWSKSQKYNYLINWKYLDYPSDVWGLGGKKDPNTGLTINFSNIKLHQSILREILPHFYLGGGFYYDRFWNIVAIDQLNKQENRIFQQVLQKNKTSSSLALKATYDTRNNPINATKGFYLATTFRNSTKMYGSDENWNNLVVDFRKYVNFPRKSNNTIALWAMGWYSSNTTTPYFLMPSSGWDDYQNTARGTAQGRYRGFKMNYFEGEYRFSILKNGLIGGVVFANMQTFPKTSIISINNPHWGSGFGLRIKLNKHSSTNICIDFGFGEKEGIATNIGEVY